MNRRGLSIKKRLTFWYAFVLVVVLALVFALLFLAGDRMASEEARENLTISTDRAVRDVQIIDGKMVIDDDITYYVNGVYVVLCREDGSILSGLTPDGFDGDDPFQADEVRKVGKGKNTYFIYDRRIENQQTGTIWIRGVTAASLEEMAPTMAMMIRIFLIILPILFLLALQGGWIIVRRALSPLTQIADTVDKIQEGSDLSQRVGLGDADSGDEVHRIAGTFDHMLERIQESFESEKRFTNDASHELRTPAAVIMASSEYALDNLNDPTEVEDSLKIILAQSKKMTDLIGQLLTMARADRGIQKVQRHPADLGLICEEAAASLKPMAVEKKIQVMVSAKEGIQAMVDANLVSRMLENLISNAIKYGRQGGHVWVTVTGGEEIQILVNDDGRGISSEDLKHIWERFYRSDDAPADEASMGLGLPLVRWIAEAHGGGVQVKSQPDVGTTFTVTLPGEEKEDESR